MNSTILSDMENYIESNSSLKINSFLIVRHGYLIFEHYGSSYDNGIDKTHHVFSVTKSVVSAMYGIAIEQGLISVNDYVLDFFPDCSFLNMDENKTAIQIRHLLTMSAGLPESSIGGISVLNLTMLHTPGTVFLYNNDLVNVLVYILERVIGYSAYDFAEQNIFKPLDFGEHFWMTQPDGTVFGSHGLVINARDMAKFGMLYLHDGVFNGRRILTSNWVNQSISKHINITASFEEFGFTDYGYLWWNWAIDGFKGPCAVGALDQRILIDPEHEMVVIAQSGHYGNYFFELLENFIFPSIIS
jgi:CubicO group peptidase (beta-lactamase class C family)